MKKKDLGAKIILAVFVIVICLAWFWWLLFARFMDTENHEKRKLAELPHLSPGSYTTFSKDFSAYIDDRIPFRNNMITLNNEIDHYVFNKSANTVVIKGEDDWFYYNPGGEEDTIKDYRGEDLLSQEELDEIADNCIRQRDALAAQGREFVIFIAPNKERVYPEHMPSVYGEPSEGYAAKQIYDYLTANTDLRVVYPYDELMKAKELVEQNIYYKTDTHWNYIGAYVGTAALLHELGIEMPAIDDPAVTISDEGPTAGDLAEMLNMSKQLRGTDREYAVHGYDEHACRKEKETGKGLERYSATGADARSLYLVRDSFGTHMLPFVASQFNDSAMHRGQETARKDIEACDPDIVVLETVERRVRTLGTFTVK